MMKPLKHNPTVSAGEKFLVIFHVVTCGNGVKCLPIIEYCCSLKPSAQVCPLKRYLLVLWHQEIDGDGGYVPCSSWAGYAASCALSLAIICSSSGRQEPQPVPAVVSALRASTVSMPLSRMALQRVL